MSVTRKDVEHVARLAELAVEPNELADLTAQLDRIVGFVASLNQVDTSATSGERFIPGPGETPLREDVVRPANLAIPPARLAPEFVDGFFVVPRLGAMEEEP
jgi:aspartyl-tRNA(Asn)/glutamyl-tRNA(Gln) amidotransferase subunit C